jgi:hypothetical protein
MKTKLKIWILLCFVLTTFTFGQSIEGKITKISGDKIEINLGTLDGIVKDTHIEIYKKSKLLHPVTGEEIRTQKERIGVIRIDGAGYDKSSGTLVTYQKTPVVGDLVEIMLDDYEYTLDDKTLASKGQVKDLGLNNAIITLGKRDNIEEGLIFDVYRSSQAVNPETGEKIPSKAEKVGKLIVSTVRETDSYCRIVDGAIQIGDEVTLANEQQDDINLQRRLYDQPDEVVQQVMKDPGIGRIYKIDAEGIHLYFDKLYNFKAGDILAVYRHEKLIHPVTNKFLGEELIKVGEISLTDLSNKEGIAKVISSDADIKVADVVKVLRLASREPDAVTEETGDPAVDDSGMRQQALNLTKEILSIQKELSSLKVMAYKVDQIDRELREQRKLTTSLQEDVAELKDLIKYGTIERKEPLDGGPEVSILGETPSKENTLTVRYSDDIPLKFQIKNRTLTVGIDVDSSRFTGMEYQADDSTAAMMMAETVSGAWYTNWLFWAGATILELLAIGFLVMTIKKKKGKVSAGDDEDMDEEEEDEDMDEDEFGEGETEEEDDFGGEEEEEGEADEEIGEPEEEIEDIEELGEEEEEILDDEAL